MNPFPRIPVARRWLVVAAGVAVSAAAAVGLVGQAEPPPDLPGQDAPASLVLAGPDEPGEALVVRGRVFAPDGETPVPGVVLYVYQTAASGRYAPPGERVPRIRGWLRTDGDGRYEYRTIRPGPYPGRDNPAHIHVFLWGAGYEPQWTPDVLFADDPLLPAGERARSREAGRFAHVCSPGRTAEGELLCTRHYRLKPTGDSFPDEVGHAFEAPDAR